MFKANEQKTGNYTYEDIAKLYTQRYVNEKKLKKYEFVDEQQVLRTVSNILPEYLDFVANIINVNDIQFSTDRKDYCKNDNIDENGNVKIKIFSVMDDSGSGFLHEMGHTASFSMAEEGGCYDLLKVDVGPEGSLLDVFNKEFIEKAQEIKNQVMEEHRAVVGKEIGYEKYQSIADNHDFVKEFLKLGKSLGGIMGIVIPSLLSTKKDMPDFDKKYAQYEQMKEKVNAEHMIANINQLKNCNAQKEFVRKNIVILDMLSSVFNMQEPYDMQLHSQNYYKSGEDLNVDEFWASMFELKVSGKTEEYKMVEKYLPKTCRAFETAFDTIKDFFALKAFLQNNDTI